MQFIEFRDGFFNRKKSSLCECIKMLNEKNIGALVVVNCENKICGIVSIGDIVKFLLGMLMDENKQMKDYIAG